MHFGKIIGPYLDDRDWMEIRNEALAKARQNFPEWTDHQISDPGVTLVELFAWIAEGLIYRLNKVPEKHFIKLLELLHIYRDPPSPAHTMLSFTGNSAVTIPKHTRVSTIQNEEEESIVFETVKEIKLEEIDGATGTFVGEVEAFHIQSVNTREYLGKSDGETPFQVFHLKNAPVYENDIEIIVGQETDGQMVFEKWALNNEDTFSKGGVKEYRLSSTTGEVIFGNHLNDDNEENRGSGLIPLKDAQIYAQHYRCVVGGRKGNVPKNSLILLKNPIPGVVVTNTKPAEGGSDQESIEDTKRRAPEQIKLQNRAVTADDYEFFAREADTGVGKVMCLGPKLDKEASQSDDRSGESKFIDVPFNRNPGHVTVLLTTNQVFDVERKDEDVVRKPGSTIPIDIQDSENLITRVTKVLEELKVLTSILYVDKPVFVEMLVDTGVFYKQGENETQLLETVKNTIAEFLHPVSGGKMKTGWEIGQDFFLPDLFDTLRNIPGVSYISKLIFGKIEDGAEKWMTSGEIRMKVDDHEIICAALSSRLKISMEADND